MATTALTIPTTGSGAAPTSSALQLYEQVQRESEFLQRQMATGARSFFQEHPMLHLVAVAALVVLVLLVLGQIRRTLRSLPALL